MGGGVGGGCCSAGITRSRGAGPPSCWGCCGEYVPTNNTGPTLARLHRLMSPWHPPGAPGAVHAAAGDIIPGIPSMLVMVGSLSVQTIGAAYGSSSPLIKAPAANVSATRDRLTLNT